MGIRAASVVAFVLSFAVPAATQSGAPTELVQAMAVQPEPAVGIVVQVVGEKGKPAKAPLVCVLPAVWTDEQKAKVEELHKTHALRPNEAAAAVAHAFGTAFRADATGTVRVPADARRVMACDGGFVGEVVLGKVPDGPVSVRLLGPRAVFARVRTAEGKVVGDVPLMVGSGRFGLGETYRSDARGESVLRLRLGERMQEDMWVEAVLPGARQRMDLPSPWPRSAIDLVVAPSGMLRVIAYDAKEQPRTDVRRVRLLWDGDFLGVEGKAEPSGAMFRVATHMRYEVEVTFAGTGGTQKVSCAGPERAGEMVVCEVRGVTGPPVLAVRVLGTDGEPLASTTLGVVVRSSEAVRGFEVKTDGDGVLRQLVDDELRAGEELFVVRRDTRGGTRQAGGALGVRTTLPAAWQTGENRLPDVTLLEEPVVVSGRVVDDAGQPVAKAFVSVRSGWARRSSSSSGTMFGNSVTTDKDGQFTLRDVMVDGDAEVFVSASKGREATQATFAKGTLDANLVVHRLGRVRVTLADVPADASRLLRGYLVAPGAKPDGDGQEVGGDSFLTARAGTYDFVLSLPQDPAELTRIPNVTVQAGVDSDEPRLLGLSWQGFVKGVRITAVTADDKPAADVQVMVVVRRGRSSHGSGGRTGKDGTFFTFVPERGADITVGGRSDPFAGARFRNVLLEDVTSDQRVVLRNKLVVRLTAKVDTALPRSANVQWTTSAADNPLEMFLASGGFASTRLLPGNVVEAALDKPGKYSVSMVAFETVDGRQVPHRFDWGKVEVLEAEGVQSFAIELAPDDVTRLAELRERLQAK